MSLLARLARAARRRAVVGVLVVALADVGWTLGVLPSLTSGRWRRIDELPAEGSVALILASTLGHKGEPTRLLSTRLQTGLALYQAGKARWILVSGYEQEPVAMRRWLEQHGVPPAAIVADFSSRRTYESLQRAAAVYGLRRILVVTSDFHLPRALWLAGHLGIEAEGVPASSAGFSRSVRTRLAIREYAARNRAVLDVWFPPRMKEGPHDPAPEGG